MASPTPSDFVTTDITGATTSHVVNIPVSAVAGDRVVVGFGYAVTGQTITPPAAGVIAERTDEQASGGTNGLYTLVYEVQGAETTITIGTSLSTKSASVACRITGDSDTDAATITGTSGINGPPDPPVSSTPPSSKDYLFVALGSMGGEVAMTAAPASYSNFTEADSGTGGAITTNSRTGIGTRQLTTGTAQDPGAFTGGDATQEWAASTILFHPAPSGIQVAVGQATETDTSQAIGHSKLRAVTQAAETDTAQAITARHTRSVAQATETDTAQAVAARKTRAVAQATETDTAQQIRAVTVIPVGQATETDTAQTILRIRTVAVGTATETDTAQTATVIQLARRFTNSFEGGTEGVAITEANSGGGSGDPFDAVFSDPPDTRVTYDTVRAVLGDLSAELVGSSIGDFPAVVWETSFYGANGAGGRREIWGRVYVYPTAVPSPGLDHILIGAAANSGGIGYDAGITPNGFLGIGRGNLGEDEGTVLVPLNEWSRIEFHFKRGTGAGSSEAQARLYAGHSTTLLDEVSFVTGTMNGAFRDLIVGNQNPDDFTFWIDELDLNVIGFPGPVAVEVGQAVETDTAHTITGRKTRAVGQAVETDTAQAITSQQPIIIAVAQATETDTAGVATPRHTRAVVQATETDTAGVLTPRRTISVAQATETDTAQQIRPSRVVAVGTAVETDTAQAVGHRKTAHVGQAVETDTARPITAEGATAVEQAVETDTAQPITVRRTYHVGLVVETDTAGAVTLLRTVLVGQAVETDTALALRTDQIIEIGQAVEIDVALSVSLPRVRFDAPSNSARVRNGQNSLSVGAANSVSGVR